MSEKYEVEIWNWEIGELQSILITNNYWEAWLEVLKQHKKWSCVYLIRRNI